MQQVSKTITTILTRNYKAIIRAMQFSAQHAATERWAVT